MGQCLVGCARLVTKAPEKLVVKYRPGPHAKPPPACSDVDAEFNQEHGLLPINEYILSLEYEGDATMPRLLAAAQGGPAGEFLLMASAMTPPSMREGDILKYLAQNNPTCIPSPLEFTATMQSSFIQGLVHSMFPASETMTAGAACRRWKFGDNPGPAGPGMWKCPEVLPCPFSFDRDVEIMLDAAGIQDAVNPPHAPQPFAPDVFPGLCLGSGGRPRVSSCRVIARSQVAAVLLNRLAANTLLRLRAQDAFLGKDGSPASAPTPGPPEEVFSVSLDVLGTEETHTTVSGFLSALDRRSTGAVGSELHSMVTSFGVDMCLLEKADGKPDHYRPVPVVFSAKSGVIEPQTGEEIEYLMHHGFLALSHKGLGAAFNVQWYTGLEGFTGWHSEAEAVDFPWFRCGPGVHRTLTSRETMRMAGLSSACSLAVNQCADDAMWTIGGYGHCGVCNDSAAWLEQAVFGSTTYFPLLASSACRAQLSFSCRKLAMDYDKGSPDAKRVLMTDESGETLELGSSLTEIAEALVAVPGDVQVPPDATLDALRRMKTTFGHAGNTGPFSGARRTVELAKKAEAGWATVMKTFAS